MVKAKHDGLVLFNSLTFGNIKWHDSPYNMVPLHKIVMRWGIPSDSIIMPFPWLLRWIITSSDGNHHCTDLVGVLAPGPRFSIKIVFSIYSYYEDKTASRSCYISSGNTILVSRPLCIETGPCCHRNVELLPRSRTDPLGKCFWKEMVFQGLTHLRKSTLKIWLHTQVCIGHHYKLHFCESSYCYQSAI